MPDLMHLHHAPPPMTPYTAAHADRRPAVRALDYYKVPEREKKELVDAYVLSKSQVVTSSQ
jgi:hypothetical protein